jgi:adenylate cyclase
MTHGSIAAFLGSILVVDDDLSSQKLLSDFFFQHRLSCVCFTSAEDALASLDSADETARFDLAILDLMLPGMSGFGACIEIRRRFSSAELPILMITGASSIDEKTRGLEIGVDEYLTKPVHLQELLARVKALTGLKKRFSAVSNNAKELGLHNKELVSEVRAKAAEINSLHAMRRFLSPSLVAAVAAADLSNNSLNNPLRSHRREIAVVVIDIRGFTALSLEMAPEDLMRSLDDFHKIIGTAANVFDGTIERFTGDGVLVFFNDPVPQPDYLTRAYDFARTVQLNCITLKASHVEDFTDVNIGIGMANGYATLGEIGSDWRRDYAAIGPVTILANRLCTIAEPSEILLTTSIAKVLNLMCDKLLVEYVEVKGFERPASVIRLKA